MVNVAPRRRCRNRSGSPDRIKGSFGVAPSGIMLAPRVTLVPIPHVSWFPGLPLEPIEYTARAVLAIGHLVSIVSAFIRISGAKFPVPFAYS